MDNLKLAPDRRVSQSRIIVKDFKKNKLIYLMGILGISYYIIFKYWPMYGSIIAFKNFRAGLGIWGSPWAGLEHFKTFFSSIYCLRLIRNTALLSIYDILFGFPAPIILALLLNELKKEHFKRLVQTVTYMPHFISLVVICGLLKDFASFNGLINNLFNIFGAEETVLLQRPEVFRPIYIISGIWQSIGWSSIIYLAALSNVDVQLYDSAKIDGANRFEQAIHITLPSIVPTIMILLILKIGSIMGVGHEKILLLYNSTTYETADVLSTYVYRRGLLDGNYSFSTAVGLFNSVINFFLIILANAASKKFTENSLW